MDKKSYTLRMRAGCAGGGKGALIQEEKSGTLCPNNDQTLFVMRHFGDYVTGEVASTLKNRDYKDATDLVVGIDCRNATESEEIFHTLQAKPGGGQSLNYTPCVYQHSIVRRLTPLECERLQGYPDGWTDIGEWEKTDKKGVTRTVSSADSLRYKALGNSIALPPWAYVLTRLSLCVGDAHPTMASLFDGIGGFPLIWEWLNGKGTCLWASEIEDFPIAVTKQHFSEEDTTDENYIPQF
jgi:DNA (cytosine-5)-methyltransferase 1